MIVLESQAFADYAQSYLAAAIFIPDFERENERLFAASLASTNHLIAALGGYKSPAGAPFSASTGFVEAMTPNAFAARHESVHVIGMHAALLVTLADFALYAFTQRGFLPSIGNPGVETSPIPAFGEAPGLFLIDRTARDGVIEADADRHRVPKDAARHEAAIYLSVLMARFVWFHEWAHCALGHVDYLAARGASAYLHEIPVSQALVGIRDRGSQDDTELRHAMELEADRAALTLTWRFQTDGQEPVPGILAFDIVTRIEMTAIAALLVAWLFEEYQRHMDTHTATTHPTPRDRLHRLADMARAMLAGDPAHDAVFQSFAALRDSIPAMPEIATEALQPLPDKAELETTLAPFRYVRG